MKVKNNSKPAPLYRTIKIRESDYQLVRENKEKTGVNIDFFIGKLIQNKLGKKQKQIH